QAEDGIRDFHVTGVQTCALPICKEQSGIYVKGFRLLDAANQIATLFSIQLIPLFSRMLKQREDIEKMVKTSFTLLVTPALIVSRSEERRVGKECRSRFSVFRLNE